MLSDLKARFKDEQVWEEELCKGAQLQLSEKALDGEVFFYLLSICS